MRILIFGNSITYGAWDREGGWVQRLRKFLDEKNLADEGDFSVYNLGVSTDNTEDLLKRFESETKHRLDEEEETVFIFAIGINDSQFVYSKNSLRVSPEKFKGNIQTLINSAKQFSPKIIFVGLAPVDESKTVPIPWNTDKSYKNEYIQKYGEVIKNLCEENQINYIKIFDKLTIADLEDGVHPTSDGHQKIFEIVKEFLIANKII